MKAVPRVPAVPNVPWVQPDPDSPIFIKRENAAAVFSFNEGPSAGSNREPNGPREVGANPFRNSSE